ncbi:MAG: hypothetical protein O2968_15455 [Acidobacteria bacterium]|nr:hypothetical protein [Acidobacteriota bacterium]
MRSNIVAQGRCAEAHPWWEERRLLVGIRREATASLPRSGIAFRVTDKFRSIRTPIRIIQFGLKLFF